MRKQTKIAAMVSAAALLAIGASMTSFAGWQREGDTWVYTDRDGDWVTEEWKKDGSFYYWLDEDGYMAKDQLINDGDNTYYVDANGVRVSSAWYNDTENAEDVGDGLDSVWYYFGSSGKAYSGRKVIDGKTYIFDEDDHYMLSGWVDYTDSLESTSRYYLGTEDEGWAYTGWQYLAPDEEIADDYEDEVWFNFKGNGKMRGKGRAYLDGAYYEFDANGVMIEGWVPPVTTDPNSVYYRGDGNGSQPTGWVYAYAQNDENEDGDQAWYYLDSKGRPFNAGGNAEVATVGTARKYTEGKGAADNKVNKDVAARVIKKKTYLFDNTGKMLTGVYYLTNTCKRNASGTYEKIDNGYYYFNKGSGSIEGQMETGKQDISYDGEVYHYNFRKDGRAYTCAIVDNVLYGANGVRINSDEGNSPYVAEFNIYDKDGDLLVVKGETIIVGASGKVKKSGNVTIDGVKYKVSEYIATVDTSAN